MPETRDDRVRAGGSFRAQGFREFLVRGNIVDLAVAVVVGTALVALVTAFSTSFVNPVLAAFGPADSLGLGYQLRESKPSTFLDVGAFVTAIITFLITAAVVYLAVVVPMRKVTARFSEAEDDDVPPDLALLTEIRDLLRAQHERTGAADTRSSTAPPTGTT